MKQDIWDEACEMAEKEGGNPMDYYYALIEIEEQRAEMAYDIWRDEQ